MRPRAAAAALLAASALAAAGCGGAGGSTAPPPEPPPPGSAYFVGTASNGVGATLDLRGSDPATRALEAALRGDAPPQGPAPSVGIASVVNTSSRPAPAPTFAAVLDSGALLALQPAAEALAGRSDRAARRAVRLLPPAPATLPAGASAEAYVVLREVAPRRVAEVLMGTGPGPPARLARRPR